MPMNDDLTFLGEYGWLTMIALLSALIVSGAVLFFSNGSQVSIEHGDYPPVRYATHDPVAATEARILDTRDSRYEIRYST